MKHRQIIDILNIPLLKVGRDMELLTKEMQRVEGFRLGFRNGRDIMASREGAEADEVAACVLEDDAFGCLFCGWLVEDERAGGEGSLRSLLKAGGSMPLVKIKMD